MRGFENNHVEQRFKMTNALMAKSPENKREQYEYMLKGFVDWFCERKGLKIEAFNANNDLSKLKIVKLTFFTSAIKFGPNEECDLLDVFDNFYAMPLGPIESDLLNAHNHGVLKRFDVDAKRLNIVGVPGGLEASFAGLADDQKQWIDAAIRELKKVNPRMIEYYPMQLVDISHEWSCWKYQFQIAKLKGKLSDKIPVERIRKDTPCFF
jgi:uncharacterized phage-associated protein